jgi:hypothetical protein
MTCAPPRADRAENLFQDAALGQHRREVGRLGQPPGVRGGDLRPAEADEQAGGAGLGHAQMALELQAAGEVQHPGRG